MTDADKIYKEICLEFKNHKEYCLWIKCETCPYPSGKYNTEKVIVK